MLFNDKVVTELVAELGSGDDESQLRAVQHVRDLCSNSEAYRIAFVAAGVLAPLCGMLDDVTARRTGAVAAQALALLSEREEWRLQIRDSGGADNMVETLRKDKEVSETCLDSVLAGLNMLAADPKTRDSLTAAGALQAVTKLLSNEHCEEVLGSACDVLQALAYNREMQDKIRVMGGLTVLVKKVGSPVTERSVVRSAMQALTVLVVAHQENQDDFRFLGGIPHLLKQLQLSPYDDTTAAAADALRAACQNNDGNKAAVRKEWGIPLLVLLLAPGVARPIVERVVDCLRILTTGSDENKSALMSCAAALPSLVNLLGEGEENEAITERAASVIRNLSTVSDHFGPLRESGAVQKLVRLLDKGPESKLTEVAVVAMANLAQESHNRKSLKLAGGVPPLMQLMLDTPDKQLQEAAELALERLGVTDAERNAILDAFRYAENRYSRLNAVTMRLMVQDDPSRVVDGTAVIGPKPLGRYTPEDVAVLLHNLCLPDVSLLRVQGVTGGELLELTQEDCVQELGWTKLQYKKVETVQRALKLFNHVCTSPGQGHIAFYEMQKWLEGLGLATEDVQALVEGFRAASLTPSTGTLTFQDFVRNFHWMVESLEGLGAKLQPPLAGGCTAQTPANGNGCA